MALWRTTVANETVTLPIFGNNVSLLISWGDGQISENHTIPITYTFASPGVYQVSIFGRIKNFGFNSQGDASKLVAIESWGNEFEIGPLDANIFAGCANLQVTAPPDTQPAFLPNATLKGTFKDAVLFNSSLSWDLSNVTRLDSMFSGATKFNQQLTFTNMQSVISMDSMFENASSFNQPVNFQTDFVTSMKSVFAGARSFNQPVNFNTSNVQSINSMFAFATSFNQAVNFDTKNVIDMSFMFNRAASFAQNVNFDTSKVESMDGMFQCSPFQSNGEFFVCGQGGEHESHVLQYVPCVRAKPGRLEHQCREELFRVLFLVRPAKFPSLMSALFFTHTISSLEHGVDMQLPTEQLQRCVLCRVWL